jgi:hypothetical protein
MTVRVTLRLPETVYERIVKASAESGRSLNQVMVDALQEADLKSGPPPDASELERLKWAMRYTAPPISDEDYELMDEFMKEYDDGEDIEDLTHEQLWERMPKLPPDKWLSNAVIEDREDRV